MPVPFLFFIAGRKKASFATGTAVERRAKLSNPPFDAPRRYSQIELEFLVPPIRVNNNFRALASPTLACLHYDHLVRSDSFSGSFSFVAIDSHKFRVRPQINLAPLVVKIRAIGY
jgi:hypothetical protein